MLGEKPGRDPIAGFAEFVDADHLDKPGLHQIVERVEVLLADFSHAAIVAAAGHQIMISRPTDNVVLCPSPSKGSGVLTFAWRPAEIGYSASKLG